IQEMQGILKTGQTLDFVNKGDAIAWLDKQMIRNILLNLISNAIKFSPENTSIKLKSEIDSNTVSIEVSDSGMGIPKEEQEHLFERFFRAKNATNIQGTGLGLNIVVKYLESMNGTIEFKSELGEGTTF